MKNFAFDVWDAGRLNVNRDFSALLDRHALTSFDAVMNFVGGRVAKNVLRERTTTRLDLVDDRGETQTLFLKRHWRPPLAELVKPYFRLTRPILGARNEWEAILRFHEAGIATMTPVALGELDPGSFASESFLLTSAIEGCRKLSEWFNGQTIRRDHSHAPRQILAGVADVARAMHAAGLHHQDFYLTHLMAPEGESSQPIHVLDLGRVRWRRRLSQRWIVKDLAQLNYSASALPASDRLRFLSLYLDRPITAADRALIHRVLRKSRAIARHSRKNNL